MSEWRRLSEREGLAEPDDSLYEGVPPWLRKSLEHWVDSQIMVEEWGQDAPRAHLLREIERRCRIELKWRDGEFSAHRSLIGLMESDPRKFLDVVDALLTHHADDDAAYDLKQILSEGGSLWKVDFREDRWVLERRVEATVAGAAQSAMRRGRAGELLSRAWGEMYGREPNPSAAYRDAVRAVEAAAQPIVLPKDPKATLGKIIPAMRDAPAKWRVVLQPDGIDPVDAVIAMLELLWRAQHDRHGDPDTARPLVVSDREAEAAVHLAATLVHLFSSGALTVSSA